MKPAHLQHKNHLQMLEDITDAAISKYYRSAAISKRVVLNSFTFLSKVQRQRIVPENKKDVIIQPVKHSSIYKNKNSSWLVIRQMRMDITVYEVSPSEMVFMMCRKHISRLLVSAWSSLSKREPNPMRDWGLAN